MSGGGLGVDNTSRRKFRDEYAKRKLEQDAAKVRRLQEEAENPERSQRRKLNPPVLDFKSQVGKTTLCASPDVGFTCDVCNVTKKDHLSLLDHINSQEHINAVGQDASAAPKKVTALDIRNKLSKFKAVDDPAPSKKKKSKKPKDDN